MSIENRKLLLTVPSSSDPGGVTSLFNALLPHLPENITMLEIGSTKGRGKILHPLFDQLYFHKKLSQHRPAMVHINPSLDFKSFIRDGLFSWKVKQQNLPLLIFWHGWDTDFAEKVEKKYLWFFLKTFGRADRFIVLASDFKSKLKKWGITVPITIGTTAVEAKLLKDFDLETKLLKIKEGPETFNILFLGRLEPAKGIFETIKAVDMLLKKNFPVRLTIAGDGKYKQKIENLTRSIGLTNTQVLFTGDIRGTKKIQVLSENHIYCLPSSYHEGLPNSILEAMAFGLPIITKPVGGLKDMFEDGKMGHLVKSNDVKEIAEHIERLILTPCKISKIGKYNALYAKKHFMASHVAKKLAIIYDQLNI